MKNQLKITSLNGLANITTEQSHHAALDQLLIQLGTIWQICSLSVKMLKNAIMKTK